MLDLCTNCGRSRSASLQPCACLPPSLWRLPAMVEAIERLDVVHVVRLLRAHPLTRHLSQSALARLTGTSQATISKWESEKSSPDIRRSLEVLRTLGVPGAPGERRWILPSDYARPTDPVWTEPPAEWDTYVVISAPVPLDVQSSADRKVHYTADAVVMVVDRGEVRLHVPHARDWGMTTVSTGATTAWIPLNPKDPPLEIPTGLIPHDGADQGRTSARPTSNTHPGPE